MIALIRYFTREARMFQLDPKSRKSIYEQIINNMKELIIAGVLNSDEKLPSVREMSRTLTVNPNTIQKAYRELERQRYVYSVSGVGTFVSASEDRGIDNEMIYEIKKRIQAQIKELEYAGLKKTEIKGIIEELLNGGGINK